MVATIFKLIILFFVIFDPLMSFMVFFSATKDLPKSERRNIATLAIILASGLSFIVLLIGKFLLEILSTDVNDFRVAGGIILLLLGIKMTLGGTDSEAIKERKGAGIAAIIATPLLTGPAAITAIIINANDFGKLLTGLAVGIVLFITGIVFFNSDFFSKHIGKTTAQVLTTILGLITIAWGVDFIRTGLGV